MTGRQKAEVCAVGFMFVFFMLPAFLLLMGPAGALPAICWAAFRGVISLRPDEVR